MSGDRGKRLPSPDDTLTIALSLARAGWPVFPVTIYKGDDGKRHKVPAVPRGTSWVDWATTDAEKIATAWQGESLGCWIGVYVGGAGLVVLDVDTEPHDGRKSLKRAGLTPPPTFSYKTLGGGRHHLYAAPEGRTLTNAQGLRGPDGTELKGVDVRGGRGLFVYYGPALGADVDEVDISIKRAPDWMLVDATPKGADAAPSADEQTWRARLVDPDGKPPKSVRKVLKRVAPTGMSHDDMLATITELVKLGTAGEKGVGIALDAARDVYARDWPDAGRHWDNAVAGSVKRIGLPPVTIPMSKAERRVVAERNDPKAIEAVKTERRAAIVYDRIVSADQITDAALAEVLAEELRPTWANVPGLGLIRYDGTVWQPAEEATLTERVRQRLRVIRAEVTREAIMRGDNRTEQEAKTLEARSKIVATARLIAGIYLDHPPKLDADPDVLNVRNGVVDLRTGILRERRADDYFTKVAAAEYHPGARSPHWDKALKALPRSSRDWLQVRLGQATTGRISRDKSIPFCLGGGDNGKSAVLGGVRAALGDYAVTVPERLLLGSDNDHPTDIMTLEGARMAIFEELPRGGRLNAQRLKLLAGTNKLSGRKMRMDFREFVATHTLIGATNHLPVITDVDEAIWNRVAPLPFPYKFVEGTPKPGTNQRPADTELRDRLAEAHPDDAAAMLAWLVEGAVTSYRVVPGKPKAVREAHDEWRGEADPVLGFFRDHLDLDEHAAIAATDLYAEFGRYLESRGQPRWSDQLIATSFTGHSTMDGVTKRQVLFGGSMLPSRPAFVTKAIQPRAMAWVGVKFRTEAPPVPMSPEVADLEARLQR